MTQHPLYDTPEARLAKIRDEYLGHIDGGLLKKVIHSEIRFETTFAKIPFKSNIELAIRGEIMGQPIVHEGDVFQPFCWDVQVSTKGCNQWLLEELVTYSQLLGSVAQFARTLQKEYGGIVYEHMGIKVLLEQDALKDQILEVFGMLRADSISLGPMKGSIRASEEAFARVRAKFLSPGIYQVPNQDAYQIVVQQHAAYLRKIY